MIPLPATPRPRFAVKADTYDAHARVQAEAAEWLAEWLPESGPNGPNGPVLELGAGTGLFTRHLAERFENLTCTDLSREMLDVCEQRVPGPGYLVQDAWSPLLNSGTWDLVSACSLLQWATEPAATLAHWRNALHPNGRILAAFFIAPTLAEMEAVMGQPGPVQWRDTPVWQEIFQAAGLRALRIEAETRRYTFNSAMDFWKALHGTGATVSRQLKPSALLRFFRDYEARFPDPAGVYSTWTFCRVELARA